MSETAAAQLRRILHLIPALADDREHRVSDVAERLGVDRATLVRDLRAIAERWDDPAGFVEGLGVYVEADTVSVHSSHFRRPMRLVRAELVALELGLAMLRAERPPEEHDAIDRARARLEQVIAELPDEPAGAGPPDALRWASSGDAADPALLARLRVALRERRKIRLSYHKPAAEQPEARVVCPYTLAHASGSWYLLAHCERSDALRVFRLDRVADAEPLEMSFELPEGFEPAQVLREQRRVFQSDRVETLTVRYSPSIARWIAEREGAEPAEDGSLTLEHPLADLDWAARHVLQYGPDAQILAPEAARAELRRRLEAMRSDA
jgi:proteasome accessory factor C